VSAEIIYRDAMERRACAFGKLESAALTAMEQLKRGNDVAAFETLRRATDEAREVN
jgi:hypothetical protein